MWSFLLSVDVRVVLRLPIVVLDLRDVFGVVVVLLYRCSRVHGWSSSALSSSLPSIKYGRNSDGGVLRFTVVVCGVVVVIVHGVVELPVLVLHQRCPSWCRRCSKEQSGVVVFKYEGKRLAAPEVVVVVEGIADVVVVGIVEGYRAVEVIGDFI